MTIDFRRIADCARPYIPDLCARWLPDGKRQGNEWVARNPARQDGKPGSFSINLRTGAWSDFAIGASGGDIVSLAAYLHHRDAAHPQAEAAKALSVALGLTR